MEQFWYGLLLILFVSTKDPVHCQHRFGYARAHQRLWAQQHPSCGGSLQSPIHIVGHKAVPLPLPALEMVGFHNPLPQPVLTNNGHSVSMSLEQADREDVPWIFGAVLDGHYKMEGLHFHWGSKNSQGSEHMLNGIQYPAEMHIIFRSNKYSSVQEAQQHSEGLAVLAFFIQKNLLADMFWERIVAPLSHNISCCGKQPLTADLSCKLREKSNEALSPLLNSLAAVRNDGESVRVSSTLMLASVLPRDMEVYYTYRGSLTTPPCSQAVIWIIFPECIPVSFKQLKRFRHLTAGSSPLVDNYRKAQPLGPRKVFVRRAWWKDGPRNYTRHLDWLSE